jgi:phospholipase C
MTRWFSFFLLSAFVIGLAFRGASDAQADGLRAEPVPRTPIKHFIFLMQENHTFDNYFGTYPGVAGIPPGTCMPVDPSNPQNEDCVVPFHINDRESANLDHSRRTFTLQYAMGQMDGFVYAINQRNQNGTIAMGYYDDRDLPYYWNIADEYVLFDHFFSSAHSGSSTNHMYSVAGVPGIGRTPPEGKGYGTGVTTIFDRLEESGVSWKFYVQNYDPSITYRNLPSDANRASQVVWVPLLNFDRFLDDPSLNSHIVDLGEYFTDLENGTLPSVAYIVPSGASEHPPGSLLAGQKFVRKLIQALMSSEAWSSSAFLWTYDDWGGWYDHMPPPQVDAEGYGFRVPALLVSPYARRGYIESTQLDFTSVLKFIEENWDIEPLAERDAAAQSIVTAFDFSQPPRKPYFISFVRESDQQPMESTRTVIYWAYGAALVFGGLLLGKAAISELSPRQIPTGRKAPRRVRTGGK